MLYKLYYPTLHLHTCTMLILIGYRYSDLCNNGGTYYNTIEGGYKCSCPPGYFGPKCEIRNDLCADLGVMNCYGNGICNIIRK